MTLDPCYREPTSSSRSLRLRCWRRRSDMTNKNEAEVSTYLDWSTKGRTAIWRYLLGTFLMLLIFLFLSSFAILPLAILAPDYKESLPLSLTGTLLTFVISFLSIPALVKLLHCRPSWSVALPRLRFEGWNFFTAIWVYLLVGAGSTLLLAVVGVMPIETNPGFSLATLWPVALIGLVGILIQAGSEEMLFRGYLTQFVRRFTANPYVFIGIPALLFGLPHIANISQLGGGLVVVVPYAISGALYGWVAYRTGSLWMGLGLHFMNNYSSVLLVSTAGDVLPSAAPFQVGLPSLATGTGVIAAQSLAMAVILHILLKRREARV